MSTSTIGAPPGTRRLLRNGNYLLLLFGQAVSQLGDQVFDTTLIVWVAIALVADPAAGPLAVSGVLVAALLPSVLVSPIAAALIDRWDKRRVLLRMDAVRAVLVAALVFATGEVPVPFFPDGRPPLALRLGAIYAVVFLASCCAQFFNPARLAIIGELVGEQQRLRATNLSQVTLYLAGIAGPVLAVPLLYASGVRWALLLNALSFVVSLLAILAVRRGRPAGAEGDPAESLGEEIEEGLRFEFGNRVVVAVLLSSILATLGASALGALIIFFLTGNLHTSAESYGLASSASSVGAVLGLAFGYTLGGSRSVGRAYAFSVAIMGLGMVLLARTTDLYPALGMLALIGLAGAVSNVTSTALLLRVIPAKLITRVLYLLNPFIVIASITSIALAGYLDGDLFREFHTDILGIAVGPVDTIFTGAGVLAIVAGLVTLALLPRGLVRRCDRQRALVAVEEPPAGTIPVD